MRRILLIPVLLASMFVSRAIVAHAATRPAPFGMVDTDGDGLPDAWETTVYHTDPQNADTDGDKNDDWTEIWNGFNPLGKGLSAPTDFDGDGLNELLELRFGTDPTIADTDQDAHGDGEEVGAGFSPTSTTRQPLQKSIVVHLKTQKLDQVLGGVIMTTYTVSSGKASTPTPVGTFAIMNKAPRAWSHMAGLWMPWWMQFTKQGAGLHELPEWPGGAKEGAAHLGTPVSHGCVRLGIGPAEALYDWAPIGTPVIVKKI